MYDDVYKPSIYGKNKHYRFIIIYSCNLVKNGRIENLVPSLGPRGSNQIIVIVVMYFHELSMECRMQLCTQALKSNR